MNFKYLILFLICSFIFTEEITPEQLEKIKEVTKHVNSAPDFSLNSIQTNYSDSIYVLSKMKNYKKD